MSRMFDEVKVGDRLYVIGFGEVIVISVDKDSFEVINQYNIYRTYYKDGKFHICDIEPSIFWEKPKLEYIKEKPFDLEEELRKLEVQEFKVAERNYFLIWDNAYKSIYYDAFGNNEQPNIKYFTEQSINNFMKNVKNKKITKEQFFTAYKNVFGGITNE